MNKSEIMALFVGHSFWTTSFFIILIYLRLFLLGVFTINSRGSSNIINKRQNEYDKQATRASSLLFTNKNARLRSHLFGQIHDAMRYYPVIQNSQMCCNESKYFHYQRSCHHEGDTVTTSCCNQYFEVAEEYFLLLVSFASFSSSP